MHAKPVDAARRRLLLASAGLFGLSLAPRALRALDAPRFSSYPFSLGVASGEPAADGVVLWTRLAPEAPERQDAVMVDWVVAEDEALRRVVRRGRSLAEPAWGHSLHAEVQGLKPGRWYWYAFRAGGEQSPVGRTRTAPAAGTQRVRLAFASCQHYETGFYGAYRHMAADDLELVLHLGDYIYENHGREPLRSHVGGAPRTLAEYRARHALYRSDRDLQLAHARFPWICTWDDHDVQNDYAGALSEDNNPPEQFLLRRAAAYQAYWEHLPLRLSARPNGADALLYRELRYGDLLSLHVMDDRQYRSDQPCGVPGHWGTRITDCEERKDPAHTMYGAAQEHWLQKGLSHSHAHWKLMAQQLLMAQFDSKPGPGQSWWTDGWDGYPAARTRLLGHIQQRKISNVVVLGGDSHAYFACDLKPDFDDEKSPVVASEFVGTSISSVGVPYDTFVERLADNPHVRFFDSRQRGYVRCEVTPGIWRTDFQALADVRDAESAISTLKSFVVESGRAGVQIT